MKLGFTSTSFRQIKNIEKIVDIATASEAEIIEWAGKIHINDVETARHAKNACDKAGIGISSYATYYRVGSMQKDEWRKNCEIASVMDCSSIRVWLGTRDSEKTSGSEYARILDDTRAICEAAAEYNLIVCPECHDNTFNNNTDAFLKLHSEAGCDNLRTYFQSRYKKKAYDLDRIERTFPLIETVHISYSEQAREQFPHHDKTYIDALLEKIFSLGFNGNLLLEYTCLYSYLGIPSMMVRDMNRVRERVREYR